MQNRSRTTVVTLIVAFLVAGGYTLWQLGEISGPTSPDYEIKVISPSARGLGIGGSVRIAGLQVGRVTSIERKNGNDVVLALKLKGAQTPLPTDTKAIIRLRSVVGETYVQLYPGRSREDLPDDGTIVASRVGQEVEVDQIVDVLKGPTRDRARQVIAGMDLGVGGRAEDLNRTLGGASGAVDEATSISRTLARDRIRITRLVDNLGQIMGAIGSRGGAVQALATGLQGTSRAVAARDDAVRRTIDDLPATLRQVRATTGKISRVSGRVSPVLTNTGHLITDLKPVFQRLRPSAQEGRRLLAEVGRSAPRIEPVLDGLKTLGPAAAKALPEVKPVFCQLNPAIEYLEPYDKELAMVFANQGSANNYRDATGHAARTNVFISDDALALYDDTTSKLVTSLLGPVFGGVKQRGYNPFPAPGKAGRPVVGERVSGPKDAPRVIPYTRVKAAC